jgi:hypothetical protein
MKEASIPTLARYLEISSPYLILELSLALQRADVL